MNDYQWLVSDAALPWLAQLEGQSQPAVSVVSRLRKQLSPQRVHLILETAALRVRAVAKFPAADRMFFTEKGLQQASAAGIAAYKAASFPTSGRIVDLCCGIGGDLLGLAAVETRDVVGVERDETVALLAQANSRACGVEFSVETNKVVAESVSGAAAWHLDPDRRPQNRRTSRVELGSPGEEVIEGLLQNCPHAAIKLSPAAELPEHWRASFEAEWIAETRECKQLVARSGALARFPGQHVATILRGSEVVDQVVGEPEMEVEVAESIGRFVYEPGPAVLAANLHGSLAAEHGLNSVGRDVVYFTGDQLLETPLLAAFEVIEWLPLDQKKLQSLLRKLDIGQVEIKKRCVEIDPAKLQKKLRGSGAGQATVLIAPVAGRVTAIIARRRS